MTMMLCGVSVELTNGSTYLVALHHWDMLAKGLDEKVGGWVELDSVWGDGKMMLRLDDIRTIFFASESYCEVRDSYEKAADKERALGDG